MRHHGAEQVVRLRILARFHVFLAIQLGFLTLRESFHKMAVGAAGTQIGVSSKPPSVRS
jgi:hypothetical protein